MLKKPFHLIFRAQFLAWWSRTCSGSATSSKCVVRNRAEVRTRMQLYGTGPSCWFTTYTCLFPLGSYISLMRKRPSGERSNEVCCAASALE